MHPIPDTLPILGAAAMREADRRTIEDLGLAGAVLMETAGRAAAEAAWELLIATGRRSVLVACGTGNNGGDGFVVARVLHARGAVVQVLCAGESARMSPDAAVHHDILVRMADGGDSLSIVRDASARGLAALRPFDVAVDALLGTGQASALREPIAGIVRYLNAGGRPVVAVDLPTGLDTDAGSELGEAVRARITVTFGALKPGLVLGRGPDLAGAVRVVEIGIPGQFLREGAAAPPGGFLTTDRAVSRLLAAVPRTGHKFTSGPTLVAAGSARYTGAAVLAARAAARAGSGYVVAAVPEPVLATIAPALLDIPQVALPATSMGTVDGADAVDTLLESAARAKALLVGPGLGRGPQVTSFVTGLLARWTAPAVIDADGLNALDAAFLSAHAAGRWIVTPHAAEFARLAGDEPGSTPIEKAARAARAWNAVVLLKGYPSIVAAPDGPAYVCASGNPALATAGTGDVLAGLCAGLLARGLQPVEAALCAVHLGGAASDRYAGRAGRSSMTAEDLLREIGPVLHERFPSSA